MKLQEVFAKKTYGPDPEPEPEEKGYDGYFASFTEHDSAETIQQEIDELRRAMEGGYDYDPEFGVRDQSEYEAAEYDMKRLKQRLHELTHV